MTGMMNQIVRFSSGPMKYGMGIFLFVLTITELLPHIIVQNDASHILPARILLQSGIDFFKLPINQASVLGSDVAAIIHHPERRSIKVLLKSTARCPRPVLKGRLSGKALVMIEWSDAEDDKLGRTHVNGRYSAPLDGQYFIEIIVLLCKPMDADEKTVTYEHVRTVCMENTENHRITQDGAAIEVVRSNPDVPKLGYWHSNPNDQEDPINTPLFTRIQPVFCRRSLKWTQRCMKKTTLEHHEAYTFTWGAALPPDHNFYPNVSANSNNRIGVCTIGGSHASRLARYLKEVGVSSETYEVHFPNAITSVSDEVIMNCDNIILMWGQWSAYVGVPPDSYEEHIKHALNVMSSHPRVFVVSTHYSPLGDLVGAHCPALDWRSPPMIDAFNSKANTVCEDMGVPFLDTSFLTEPMWDSSPDWCHLEEKVAIEEARYVATVLGYNEFGKNVGKMVWTPGNYDVE